MIDHRYRNHIKENFGTIDDSNTFGLARFSHPYGGILLRDIEDLYKAGKLDSYHGGRIREYHIRKLSRRELDIVPAKRFQNNIMMDYKGLTELFFPVPVALLYRGNASDILSSNIKEGYVVTQFFEGPNLMRVYKNLSDTEKRDVFMTLSLLLAECAGKNTFPMDFAPRDLILVSGNPRKLKIVDCEHIEESSEVKSQRECREQQRNQFREDYSVFEDAGKLEELEKKLALLHILNKK